jgi:hypothetical protein
MSPRTSSPDSGISATELLDRLEQLRLDKDWSYRQLSEDMRRAGYVLPAGTLHQLLEDRPNAYKRTLHKIRKYLASLEQQKATSPKRRAHA